MSCRVPPCSIRWPYERALTNLAVDTVSDKERSRANDDTTQLETLRYANANRVSGSSEAQNPRWAAQLHEVGRREGNGSFP